MGHISVTLLLVKGILGKNNREESFWKGMELFYLGWRACNICLERDNGIFNKMARKNNKLCVFKILTAVFRKLSEPEIIVLFDWWKLKKNYNTGTETIAIREGYNFPKGLPSLYIKACLLPLFIAIS